jgi:hypothetical protein
MSQQNLDDADVHASLQQVRGEAVPQRIHTLPANWGRRGSSIVFIRSSIMK